jgi:hypothetical protein
MLLTPAGHGGRLLLPGCLVLLTLSSAGCGVGKGDLSGKVSYKDKTLAYGSVLLLASDQKPRTVAIEQDGTYRFSDIPAGEARLAVYSLDPAKRPAPRAAGAGHGKPGKGPAREVPKDAKVEEPPRSQELPPVDRSKWFEIPASYGNIDRSGLAVTIVAGTNTTYDIQMK